MLKVLRKARKLILKGWTRQTFARDKRNEPVSAQSKKACKFCAAGAIYRSAGTIDVIAELEKLLPPNVNNLYPSLGTFNDRQSSKWPVVKLFDAAIKKLEAK